MDTITVNIVDNGDQITVIITEGISKIYVDGTTITGSGLSVGDPLVAAAAIPVVPAALTKTDDTNVTLTLGGTPATSLLQAVSLSLGWTGTLADARIASAATWNAKQNALGFTPEDVANKDIDSTFTANSDTKYPSQKAVKTALALKYDASNPSSYISTISGIAAGGDLSGTYPNPAVLNSAVLAKLLTGLNVTGSSLLATDNLLQAFGKLQNQINGVLGGAIYISTWAASTNTPALADGVGTKGNYYVASDNGSVNFGSGAIDFHTGDWAIYNGTIWQKVDNTDAVSSVNGYIGAVNLTSADISEVTNLYFTTARVLATALTGYVSGAGTVSATDTILQAIQKLNGNIAALVTGVSSVNGAAGAVTGVEVTANKDATGGYAGLTLFKINFKNVANTFTSFFTNSNTAARTYTFQNRDGTIADDTDLALKLAKASVPCEFIVACSDLSTALTTGTSKAYFRAPYAFTLTAVRASLLTAQTSGNIFTVDINESGTSVISTKLTIDNTENTSQTAATPPVISDSAIADDAQITIDIDQIGDGTAKGLIVTLIGTHSV